jgi:hypothetical protein
MSPKHGTPRRSTVSVVTGTRHRNVARRLAPAVMFLCALLPRTAHGLELRVTPGAVKRAIETSAFVNGELTRETANGLLGVTLRNLRVRFDPAASRVLLDADAVTTLSWSGVLTMSFRPRAAGSRLWLEDIRIEGVDSDLVRSTLRELLNAALASPRVDLEEKARSPISASPYSLRISSPTVRDLQVTSAYILLQLDGRVTVE